MICKCGKALKITHSYKFAGGRTQRGVCAACDKTYTVLSLSAFEKPIRGEGAYALAKRLQANPSDLGLVVAKLATDEVREVARD